MKDDKTQHELLGENEELRLRLQEAEETLQAIREGAVDALVVQGPEGERIFTIDGEDAVYRRLVETMNEAGLTTTPEGQILFCNERFGKMLDRPMEDILGRNLNEFVGQSYPKAIPSLLARAKAKPARMRLVFTAADGTPVPVRVSANRLQQGNSMNICIVAMDLTQLEASEEIIHQINEQRAALQTSEERYRALVESSPDAVIVHRKGQFLFANSVALELYGAGTLEALQTKTILELMPPEERPIVKQRINVIEKGGKTPLRETKILRLDGKTIPVEATAASIYFEGVPAAQVILRDIRERKQAQQAIEDAHNQAIHDKNRLEAMMDALPIGVAILDAKGGNTRSNKMFEETWRGPRPPANDIKDYVHYQAWWTDSGKPVKPHEWASAQAVLTGKTVSNQVFEIRRFDGSHAFVLNSAAPIRDAEGHITGCAVAIRDITELRRVEEAVRRHNATLESINKVLKAALTCQTEHDLGDICLTIFQELTQSKFGFIGQMNEKGLEDIAISNPGWDACTITDPGGHCNRDGRNFKIHGIYGRVISEGKAFFTNDPGNYPDRIGLPDGHPPLESFLGVPLVRESRVIGLIAVANRPGGYTQVEQETLETLAPVIVEAFLRKRAEQELESHRRHLEEMVHERTAALRRSQELLNETQRISKVGGWEYDIMAGRIFWTDEVYHIHGVSKDYDPGDLEQNIRAYMPEDRIRLTEALHRAQAYGQPFDLEMQLMTAQGNLLWVRTMGQAESKDGKVVRLYGSIMDITERKKVEAQLADKNAEIQNRAHQLSLLASQLFTTEQRERRRLAQVLHDHLQQLLVAAKFELNSMARQPGSQEHQDSIIRVTDLIKQSILESRSLTVELSPPVLHEDGLHAGFEWLARWIEEKHRLKVHLTLDSRTNIQYEQINTLLFQCVRELLFNVVKHSEAKEARVGLEMDKKSISVTVSDEGKGFDVEKMWANAVKTTGYGLFSIRERLHIIGGKMSVKSRPGKGSTFVLTLLLPETAQYSQSQSEDERIEPSEATGMPPTPREKGKLRILLVDDHPVVRRGLSLLLKQEPDIKIVGEAGNGKEAIMLCRNLKPDIILMDYGMPKMNGAQAARIIHSEFPNIRIIGLSMYEKADRADAMFKAGASAYISKSESSDKLLSTIRHMYE